MKAYPWLALLLAVLLAACANPRRDIELSRLPATRQAAAQELQQVFSEQGWHTRNVRVEDDHMAWQAAPMPADADVAWTERTLAFAEVLGVTEPVEHTFGWALAIDASGGQVTLYISKRAAALRAKAAMLRLAQPD